jgi:hypothetical protein
MMSRRPLTYLDGIGTGIAVLAIAAACWIGLHSQQLAVMYRDMSGGALSGMTKLVLSPAWIYGAPVALVGALVALHVWRPRAGFITLAALAIAIDVFWYFQAYAPIYALAGNIRP